MARAPRSSSSSRRRPPGDGRERVLAFVREAIGEGRPPTVRDVQQALGFRAVQSAQEHLAKLVAEGRLMKDEGRARGYRLPSDPPTRLVPILGRVPAGPLGEALEEPEGYLKIEARGSEAERRQLAASRAAPYFALRVQGDSMTGAGLLDGDLVVVERGASVRDGDIVVARVGGEATVKRLRLELRRTRRAGRDVAELARVELAPENPAYAPIVIDPSVWRSAQSFALSSGNDVPSEGNSSAGNSSAGNSSEGQIEFELLGRVVEVRRHYRGA